MKSYYLEYKNNQREVDMRAKSLLILLVIFLNSCIQINMPPVDDYITILISLAGFKKSNPTQQALTPASDSIPPTISYSGSPYVLTLKLPINTITPTITGTITSCISAPTLPAGLTLNNITCAISGTPTTLQAATSYTITASNPYGNTTATISITVNPPLYTVTYIGNSNTGGLVPTDSNSYSQGDTVTVKSNSGNLVKTGYIISGWNTQADGNGTTYTLGSGSFTMPANNVTLWAKWTIDPIISIAAIPGVTVPVLGDIPVTTITDTSQYTGTVTWDGGWAWSTRFGGNKAYTVTITLTPKSGFTFTGVSANFFTVAGATTVTNSANSGVVTAVFPATASVAVADPALGGKVAYILQIGDPGYVAGEQRGFIVSLADQITALPIGIIWANPAYQSTLVPGGTGTALGTGFSNTNKIIAQNGAGTTYAAGLARACTDGGYTDWFLPSRDELHKLWLDRVLLNMNTSNWMWSSTETSAIWAAREGFPAGGQNNFAKNSAQLGVRAVRFF